MVKAVSNLLGRNCGNSLSNGVDEVSDLGCADFFKESFKLRENHLYGVVIGGVGWEVSQIAACTFDQSSDFSVVVDSEVIHEYDLPRFQGGDEYFTQVGKKGFGIHCAGMNQTPLRVESLRGDRSN